MSRVLSAAAGVADAPGRLAEAGQQEKVFETFITCDFYTGLGAVTTVDGGAGLAAPMRVVSEMPRTSDVDSLVDLRRRSLS